jgi:neutral ceramidase
MPFLTGSEENRGPLYDVTGVPFEGRRLPAGSGPQGDKIQVVPDLGRTFPEAVPLTTVRVADRAIVTIPGEMTAGMGRRLRGAAERAVHGSGVRHVVISGLANDFIQYVTTPEEYDRQHYEGGSTVFGRATGVFLQERLIELLQRLIAGEPAPAPDADDPRNGVTDDEPPFGRGASSASAIEQPAAVERLDHAAFGWQGGPRGEDRPLERPFVRIQRRDHNRWRTVDDDLGLRILWTVDDDARHRAIWEPGVNARLGNHRFLITANRYRLASASFRVRPATDLRVRTSADDEGRIELVYPDPVENRDLAWRPERATRVDTRADGVVVDRYGNSGLR